ncbi:MAG: hypothetical protein US64_C0016G0001, partial [Candidatus Nomurabacteria bacterium GW2011_GWC1_37_9]
QIVLSEGPAEVDGPSNEQISSKKLCDSAESPKGRNKWRRAICIEANML